MPLLRFLHKAASVRAGPSGLGKPVAKLGKAEHRSSRDDVGQKLVLQGGDPVAQDQLALLQPLDLQAVGAGLRLQRVDGAVEIAVLLPQAEQFAAKGRITDVNNPVVAIHSRRPPCLERTIPRAWDGVIFMSKMPVSQRSTVRNIHSEAAPEPFDSTGPLCHTRDGFQPKWRRECPSNRILPSLSGAMRR